MDIIDIVLSKKYTDESLKGITGTLAGKNCTIKSATKVDGVTTVVFAWTADDGTEKTTTIQVNDGADGKDTSQEAVLFIEQTLDETQRTQARENIGAADAARQNILMGSEIGNPIVVDDAFSAPLYGLTLYGKSTQRSTTGANILKDTYLSLCKGNVDLFTANGLLTANSNYEKNVEFNLLFTEGSIFADSIKDEETYYIVFRPIGFTPAYKFQLLLKNGAYETMATSVGAIVASVSGATLKKTARIQLYFFNVSGAIPVVSGSKFQMIFSKNPDCNYEPYTGGAPSPSPSYPQEIENAGQSGEIGVSVDGGNLIKAPFDSRENPYKPGYTFTQNGITFTVQDDMGIKVAGTNTSADKYAQFNAYYLSDDEKPKYPAGTYTFSEGATVQIKSASEIVNKNGTFTVNEEFKVNGFYIAIPAGQSVNKTVYPMFNIGSTALPYEPYKPAQKLIIPTPNGLPGIPTIDNGNYTDASGQQWLCDEVDLKRGVYVQNVAFAEFGKEITVLKKNNAVSNENFVAAYFFTSPSKRIKTRQTILSNCLSYVESVNKVNKPYSISNEFDTEAMYVTIPTELYENDVQMLNLLAEKKSRYYMQLTQLRDLYPPKNLKNTGHCEPTAQQRP